MQVADIAKIIKQKLANHSAYDFPEGRYGVSEFELDVVATEVAVELQRQFTRPVLTFTHNDVIQAAAAAGFKIGPVTFESGGGRVTPFDSAGTDIYDKVHALVDWSFQTVMSRLPEPTLQQDINKR